MEQHALPGIPHQVDPDLDCAPFGELDRIVGQIDQDLTQPARISCQPGGHPGIPGKSQGQPLGGGLVRQEVLDLAQHRCQLEVHPLQFHLARFEFGSVQHVVEHAQEMFGGRKNLAQGSAAARVGIILQGQVGHADDGVQRSPDLMAHVGQEVRLGFCRLLGQAFAFDQNGRQILLVTVRLQDPAPPFQPDRPGQERREEDHGRQQDPVQGPEQGVGVGQPDELPGAPCILPIDHPVHTSAKAGILGQPQGFMASERQGGAGGLPGQGGLGLAALDPEQPIRHIGREHHALRGNQGEASGFPLQQAIHLLEAHFRHHHAHRNSIGPKHHRGRHIETPFRRPRAQGGIAVALAPDSRLEVGAQPQMAPRQRWIRFQGVAHHDPGPVQDEGVFRADGAGEAQEQPFHPGVVGGQNPGGQPPDAILGAAQGGDRPQRQGLAGHGLEAGAQPLAPVPEFGKTAPVHLPFGTGGHQQGYDSSERTGFPITHHHCRLGRRWERYEYKILIYSVSLRPQSMGRKIGFQALEKFNLLDFNTLFFSLPTLPSLNTPMSPDSPLHRPEWLAADQPSVGRYVLGPILGQGGAGEVREAWDVVLCRTVALKVLRKMEPV